MHTSCADALQFNHVSKVSNTGMDLYFDDEDAKHNKVWQMVGIAHELC